MAHPLELNEEELAELARLLENELTGTRMERRRTRNPHYRDELRDSIRLTGALLDKVYAHIAGTGAAS